MNTFEIKEDFILNGKPIKILSGAIHYFRIHPSDWYHSLYNLKALGLNTVETYVPWNLHEEKEEIFNFDGLLDIEKFIEIAESLDLLVIIRPSPYICAEFEFGGLPAWLLNKDCRIRSSDPEFIQYVDNYYNKLLPKLTSFLITNGGPIIMMQIENEYGSYGEDKEYLHQIKNLLYKYEIDVPLFTSDGTWEAALESGSLISDNILPTGNFGSGGKNNFENLKQFHNKYNKNYPLMSMEYWDGWFNRWGRPINTRDTKELVDSIRETIEIGSINLYKFQGGTTFGFMNGASGRQENDLPQITSYDYGAPLNEQGNPTEKYYEIQTMLKETISEINQLEPFVKDSMAIENIKLTDKVSLFSVINEVSEFEQNKYPQTMEKLNHFYGYILYQTQLPNYERESILRIVDANDRAKVFIDNHHVKTQYQSEIWNDIKLNETKDELTLDILLENTGRVNYGFKLLAETQRKGIRTGVMHNNRFINDWRHYKIDFSKTNNIDFGKEWKTSLPGFYKYEFEIVDKDDTYIDLSNFGKGIVLVNGFNIGRFWDIGPTLSLYIPKHLLNEGSNSIIIFETEGTYSDEINLVNKPIIKDIESGNNDE